MIYLKSFQLCPVSEEESFLMKFKRTCFDSYYPFRIFPEKHLEHLSFSDITILCGGNGCGKSTLLNIIAESLGLKRETPFNKTYFFDPYLQNCHLGMAGLSAYAQRELLSVSRIIASDDVFNHIISVRERNDSLDFKRQQVFNEKARQNAYGGWNGPKSIDLEDPESIREYRDYADMTRMSASSFVRSRIGVGERTYSNGENGFKYFVDAIQPGGLYLLDEPENSLSAEMQLQLVTYLHGMVAGYKCQIIMSTHSPFLLSLPGAMIYDLDSDPVTTKRWTELSNVKIYHDFFEEHREEFD